MNKFKELRVSKLKENPNSKEKDTDQLKNQDFIESQSTEVQIYHVFTKSIAGFKVFLHKEDYVRMIDLIDYYRFNPLLKFSEYKRAREKDKLDVSKVEKGSPPIVDLIAYCLMPTHIHLVLEELVPLGISEYMRRILDSYTRYFNKKIGRKGPLWETRFKRVLVTSDEQLLHLTRYVHLNPVSAGLVEKPEQWEYSSYKEYIGLSSNQICNKEKYLTIQKSDYAKFVEDHIDYQRTLELIKNLILE